MERIRVTAGIIINKTLPVDGSFLAEKLRLMKPLRNVLQESLKRSLI